MMMGIIAGFPRRAGIVVNSVQSGGFYGYYTEGFIDNPFGSIAPAGANVLPGAPPSVGVPGEILDCYYHSNNQHVWLRFRGPYANLAAIPFVSMAINGVAFTKGSAAGVTGYGTSTINMYWNRPPPNPLPVGDCLLQFS